MEGNWPVIFKYSNHVNRNWNSSKYNGKVQLLYVFLLHISQKSSGPNCQDLHNPSFLSKSNKIGIYCSYIVNNWSKGRVHTSTRTIKGYLCLQLTNWYAANTSKGPPLGLGPTQWHRLNCN